ncbi:imidazole glycerol phosphate synthase subunit HisH [Desulfoluna butyratoxydans]|uniref:Imidazole glycerol phosphate synthase subunit HisH n=1 Tax=Desulfoluna butyratoxydans TaxID=231438 RepID=A0A4U8YJM2_9BACT|nr:imidazole glycerol phosphate synthase subunit HisH [Desulfoluna butyratoxydans]VFQ43630.1 imidazole glycerol phosphate synthase subunit h [Desulfoluna butyratoxydans]
MIAIIDYEAGNLTSVERAIRSLGRDCVVTGDARTIREAERVIFPGVGQAGSAMASLKRTGLDTVIHEVYESGRPFMGICLGTQIILSHSREHDTPCLGLLNGEVEAFPAKMNDTDGSRLKIPHMGWNRIRPVADHPILEGITAEDEFYFVHSYYPEPADRAHALAECTYGITFPVMLGHKNLVSSQFHPEKSGKAGLKILDNFCRWQPC